jgi:hypothetical protein
VSDLLPSEGRKTRLDLLVESARMMFRTVGPRVPGVVYPDDDVAIRHCSKCQPTPKIYECPVCNWQTEEKWRFKLHLDLNPLWCRELGAKRARKWASRV